jgi:hypothetical protein
MSTERILINVRRNRPSLLPLYSQDVIAYLCSLPTGLAPHHIALSSRFCPNAVKPNLPSSGVNDRCPGMAFLRKLESNRLGEDQHAQLGLGSGVSCRLHRLDAMAIAKTWRSHVKDARPRRVSAQGCPQRLTFGRVLTISSSVEPDTTNADFPCSQSTCARQQSDSARLLAVIAL